MFFAFSEFGFPPKKNSWNMAIEAGPTLTTSELVCDPAVIAEGVHLTCEHETNYFHWMTEVIPRLLLFEACSEDKTVPLLVSAGLHENLYRFLDLVRDPERPVRFLDRSLCYRVSKLIYPGDVSRILDENNRPPSHETMYFPTNLVGCAAEIVKNKLRIGDRAGNRRVYLRRNRSYRIPVNQDGIERFLARLGFEIVDTGLLTLDEQVALFSEVSEIVAPSGAPCANVIWCNPNARLTILHSDHPLLTFPYWDALGRLADAKVNYVPCARTHTRESAHDDYRAVLADIAAYVDPEISPLLASAHEDLDEAKSQLASTRGELETAWSELASAQKELEATRTQLASTQGELEAATVKLSEAHADIAARRSKIAKRIDRFDYEAHLLLSKVPFAGEKFRSRMKRSASKRFRSCYGGNRGNTPGKKPEEE